MVYKISLHVLFHLIIRTLKYKQRSYYDSTHFIRSKVLVKSPFCCYRKRGWMAKVLQIVNGRAENKHSLMNELIELRNYTLLHM